MVQSVEVQAKKTQSPQLMAERVERLRRLKERVTLSRETFCNTFEV